MSTTMQGLDVELQAALSRLPSYRPPVSHTQEQESSATGSPPLQHTSSPLNPPELRGTLRSASFATYNGPETDMQVYGDEARSNTLEPRERPIPSTSNNGGHLVEQPQSSINHGELVTTNRVEQRQAGLNHGEPVAVNHTERMQFPLDVTRNIPLIQGEPVAVSHTEQLQPNSTHRRPVTSLAQRTHDTPVRRDQVESDLQEIEPHRSEFFSQPVPELLNTLRFRRSSPAGQNAGTEEQEPLTIFLGIQNGGKSTYAAITDRGSMAPTVNELLLVILTHSQAQAISEELLKSINRGQDYHIFRAGEGCKAEILDHFQTGCQLVDSFSRILRRIYDQEPEAGEVLVQPAQAVETRKWMAALWEFPQDNRLYILYFIPVAMSRNPELNAQIPGSSCRSVRSSDHVSQQSPAARSWLRTRFANLVPIIESLASSKFGEPYRTHLLVEMALHISSELGHSFQSKTTAASVSVIDDINISTSDIKSFVTHNKMQPATFDNRRSRLHKFRVAFSSWKKMDTESAPCAETFIKACQELFRTSGSDITAMISEHGPVGVWDDSVRSKPWKWFSTLHDEAKAELNKGREPGDIRREELCILSV